MNAPTEIISFQSALPWKMQEIEFLNALHIRIRTTPRLCVHLSNFYFQEKALLNHTLKTNLIF